MILKVKVDGGYKWLEVADRDLDSRYPGKEWEADIVKPMEVLHNLRTEIQSVGLVVSAYEGKLPFYAPHYGMLISRAQYAIERMERAFGGGSTEERRAAKL